MSKRKAANPTAKRNSKVKYVNVIMHGAFGYVFDKHSICAYTPACFGHVYNAGDTGMGSRSDLWQGVDYDLTGVKSGKKSIFPKLGKDPVLSLEDIGVDRNDIDNWDNGKSWTKRFTMIRLPYPARCKARATTMYGALHAYVGEIYTGGQAADALNTMTMCPSLHIFSYELEEVQSGNPCQLVPRLRTKSTLIDCPPIPCPRQNSCDLETVNFHVFCSMNPMSANMMKKSGMTPEGHIRRTFAALVDMFGGLELVLNFPNQFHPAMPGTGCAPALPVGVEANDLEPGWTADPCKQGLYQVTFGHVNCEYTDLIFIP